MTAPTAAGARLAALGAPLLLLCALLAGCASPDACHEPPAGRGVVQAISGRDANVLLDSGEPAVLHLSAAVFLERGGVCERVGPDEVHVRDTLAFEVDAWAESYPMQGWPETTVIIR